MKCYNTSLYKITFYIFLLVCFLSFYIASIIFLPTIFFCYTTYFIVIYSIFRNSGQPSEQCWNPHASFPQFNKYIYQGFYKHICTFYNGLISSQSSSTSSAIISCTTTMPISIIWVPHHSMHRCFGFEV